MPPESADTTSGHHSTIGGQMKAWIAMFLSEKQTTGDLSATTATSYATILNRFAESTTKRLDEIDRTDITEHLMALGGRPGTQNWRISVFKSFFGWCVATGILTRSPVATLRTRQQVGRTPRFLEREQVGPVIAMLSPRDQLIVELGVQVGLRRREVWALDVEDINWADEVIAIRGKGGRGEVTRVVPITRTLRSALAAYLAESPTFTGPVIRNLAGQRISKTTISKIVSDAMMRAGVKTGPWDGKSMHALRHTCFQHLADDGKDIRDIQALAGHSSVVVTEIYLRRKVAADRLRSLTEGRDYEAS